MFRRTAKVETPIERIFREETGRKMPPSIRRILLHKPTAERKPHLRLLPGEPRMPDAEWIKTVADGRRVKFTNQELPYDRVEDVRQLFAAYGQVDRVTIVRDRRTDGPRGFGFGEMASSD